MPESATTRCSHCAATLRLKSREAIGNKVDCPRCGKPFVAQAIRRRKKATAADITGITDRDFDIGNLPPATQNRKLTPIEEARRKRDALLRKKEEQANADKPKDAAIALLALLVCLNAHLAVGITIIDSVIEIVGSLGQFSARGVRGPVMIIILTMFAWFVTVLPRDINQRGVAAAIGVFFLIVCGVVGSVTVTAVNRFHGYDFFAVRWSAVYLGGALIVFSIWGYGKESPLQYAERMMSRGRFGKAVSAVEKILEKDPDDLRALQIKSEIREMLKMG